MIQVINTAAPINELAKACAPWINAADPQITAKEIADEQWREIPSLPGYEASNLGRVRNKDTHQLRRQGYRGTTTLYPAVSIEARHYYTHRLIAEAFIGLCPERHEVDHIDGNSFNNRAENLDYVTRRENIKRAQGRLIAKHLGRAPWMAIYDAALAGQIIPILPGGCNRGHTAEQFGTRRDGTCSACKSASINIQHDITRELMRRWYPQWQAVMAGSIPLPPKPSFDDVDNVVDIDEYRSKKAA